MLGPITSPIMPTSLQSPPLPRHRMVTTTSSPLTSAEAVKTSPLSLASITSPYHPDKTQIQGRPKKSPAQTLKLGERLRIGSEDPMIFTVMTHPVALVLVHLVVATQIRRARKFTSIALHRRLRHCLRLPIPFIRAIITLSRNVPVILPVAHRVGPNGKGGRNSWITAPHGTHGRCSSLRYI